MDGESRAAGVDGFLELAGTPALFGELREGNRRRVFLDSASKIFDSLIIGHQSLGYRDALRRTSCTPDAVRHPHRNHVSASHQEGMCFRSRGSRDDIIGVAVT